MSFLKVAGTKLVDADGKEIILRGAGLGGWMKLVQCLSFTEFLSLIVPFVTKYGELHMWSGMLLSGPP